MPHFEACHDVLVSALRMSADTHHSFEFQGERWYFLGLFTEFALLETGEKRGHF